MCLNSLWCFIRYSSSLGTSCRRKISQTAPPSGVSNPFNILSETLSPCSFSSFDEPCMSEWTVPNSSVWSRTAWSLESCWRFRFTSAVCVNKLTWKKYEDIKWVNLRTREEDKRYGPEYGRRPAIGWNTTCRVCWKQQELSSGSEFNTSLFYWICFSGNLESQHIEPTMVISVNAMNQIWPPLCQESSLEESIQSMQKLPAFVLHEIKGKAIT